MEHLPDPRWFRAFFLGGGHEFCLVTRDITGSVLEIEAGLGDRTFSNILLLTVFLIWMLKIIITNLHSLSRNKFLNGLLLHSVFCMAGSQDAVSVSLGKEQAVSK